MVCHAELLHAFLVYQWEIKAPLPACVPCCAVHTTQMYMISSVHNNLPYLARNVGATVNIIIIRMSVCA